MRNIHFFGLNKHSGFARPLLLIVITAFLSGCVSTYKIIEPIHQVADFPTVGLDYQVVGSTETNKRAIDDFLTNKGIRYNNQFEQSFTYVITTYLKEPSTKSDRRLRRTSYLIKLKGIPPKNSCTNVSISWLVESHGIRESSWGTYQSDQSYTPTSLEEIQKLFNAKKCQ